MIVKIMTCRATDPGGFHEAQQSWSRLAGVDGFMTQFGGWDSTQTDHVLLVALWRDPAAYDAFMRTVHDRIHEGSGQTRTYEDLSTVLAEPIDAEPEAALVGDCGHVRMADCRVRPGRLPHFLDVQRTTWNPGMLAAGAVAAWPLRAVADANRVFVISLWPSAATHTRYREGPFQDLRRRAQPDLDLDGLQGWSVVVEAGWTVLSP